jgi:hypothetical protein
MSLDRIDALNKTVFDSFTDCTPSIVTSVRPISVSGRCPRCSNSFSLLPNLKGPTEIYKKFVGEVICPECHCASFIDMTDLRESLSCDISDLPLYINSKNEFVRSIVKTRLKYEGLPCNHIRVDVKISD